MTRYLLRRLLQSVVVLLGISVIVFALVHMIPGGPALMILGEDANPEQIAILEKKLGLDKPVWEQYTTWLGKVIRGDFGTSYQDGRPIMADLLDRMPATLELLAAAMFVAIAIAIPVGVLSAVKRNSLFDSIGRFLALVGVSMPGFWLALILILIFAKDLRWLPASGRGDWRHLVMPAVALGFTLAGLLTRMVRSSVLEVLREDYLKTARAKGLPESIVIFKHALRNAMLPVITVIALQVGNLLGGTIVIESVFAWPGIGRFTYMRMLQRDIPTIMGNLILFAALVCVLNIVTDLLYAIFDPRIRYQRS